LRKAGAGDSDAARERLQKLEGLPALDLTEEARDLAAKLVGPEKTPTEYYEDALHIAVATINGIDFLLTWNLTHIAHATLRRMYEKIIRTEGYDPPVIWTPEELPNIDS
jgi:hypothetical protein